MPHWAFALVFWKSINDHKHGFSVIISVRRSYQTFPFIDKNDRLIFIEIFKHFTYSEKKSIFFFTRMPFFYKKQSINFGRMTTGSKLEQSVTLTLFDKR